tara:strand:- start:1 stop:432 length:432 start_codon:yes stop_codon:yes gene_type:complete
MAEETPEQELEEVKTPEEEQEDYLKSDTLRTNELLDNISFTNDPEDLFLQILEVIGDQFEPVPLPGKYYTFMYEAKTPRVKYDAHPLIACTGVYEWGFTGINYHWNDSRNYTWGEVQSMYYLVYPNELRDLKSIPYQYIKLNT